MVILIEISEFDGKLCDLFCRVFCVHAREVCLEKKNLCVLVIREDENGEWGAEQDITVFDGALSPGADGAYKFEIENPTDTDLEYTVTVTDANDWGGGSPVNFRLKMNNVYVVGNENTWMKAEDVFLTGLQFPSSSKQGFILEWSWPYESGNDEYDTAVGQMGGIYTLHISITAESIDGSEALNG